MAAKLPKLLDHLQQAAGGLTDGQLLARFVAARDEASFAALLQRHGPMVLGVCRRVLRHVHDAEDAFQATFLVLARKAASVVRRDSVGCWLYAVAYHTALEAAQAAARRRARERQVGDMPHPEVNAAETPDWLPLLDQELSRLTEKYRAAVVLCDLEGRPRKEAARLLAVPEGTLSSRLAKARKLLARRLVARGVTLSAAVLAVGILGRAATAQVPAALAGETVRAAALVAAGQLTAAAGPAVVLMKGVMKAMLFKKLRLVVGAVMVTAALGAAGFICRSGGEAVAQPPGPGLAPTGGAPAADATRLSEVEALRKKNKELQRNVDILLDRVLAQDAELEALKSHKTGGGPGPGGMSGGGTTNPFGGTGTPAPGFIPAGGGSGFPSSGGFPTGGGSSSGVIREGGYRLTPGGLPGSGGSGGGSVPAGSGDQPGAGAPGLPGAPGGLPPGAGVGGGRGRFTGPAGGGDTANGAGRLPEGNDPVTEVEAAIKALREARDKEGQQQAADALEKAMKKLRQQLKQSSNPGAGS